MGFWGNENAVRFPNLGIELSDLPKGIYIGSFEIAFYGIIIACGMLLGIWIARWQAKRTGQDRDIYLDFALWAIPLSVIGARLYYVIFNWEEYDWDFLKIINIRNGGLAIYGGVIVAITSAIVFAKIKKLRIGLFADTGIVGLILGQIIGRWGNFFNREAFGKFTDSLFAMQVDVTDPALSSVYKASSVSEATLRTMYEGKEAALNNILEIRNNIQTLSDGRQFIQVHPTFLYESVWNILVLCLMLFAWKRKKFNGEIVLIYLAGYGLGRFFVEGLRTDQLFLWGTDLAVSQVLSAILFIAAMALFFILRLKAVKSGNTVSLELRLTGCSNVEKDKKTTAVEEKSEGKDEMEASGDTETSEQEKNEADEETGPDAADPEAKMEESGDKTDIEEKMVKSGD